MCGAALCLELTHLEFFQQLLIVAFKLRFTSLTHDTIAYVDHMLSLRDSVIERTTSTPIEYISDGR
jgi:hypothetical protein